MAVLGNVGDDVEGGNGELELRAARDEEAADGRRQRRRRRIGEGLVEMNWGLELRQLVG